MSVKAMGWVWDQEIDRDQKFVLLAYADHADHDGNNIYPSVASIAKKTGYSERSVQRITKRLIENKWLIEDGTSKYQTNKYRIPMDGGDILSPRICGDVGDNLTGVTNETQGGDTSVTGGVTKTTQGGDIAMSPKPSLTVPLTIKEPTTTSSEIDFGKLCSVYQKEIGSLTDIVADMLEDDLDRYGLQMCLDAIEEAVKHNTRKWSYVNGVLKNWWKDGRVSKPKNKARKTTKQEIILPDGTRTEVMV